MRLAFASISLIACAACDPGVGGASAPDSAIRDSATPPGQRWFTDITEAAGIEVVRPDDFDTTPKRFGGGVCVLDIDGTPPMDLFFALSPYHDVGSRLYAADSSLSYVDVTETRGLAGVGGATGCLAFDADGDSNDDLLVTGLGGARLFLREGERFEEHTSELGLEQDAATLYMSAAAGDVDDDGDIDILLAGFLSYERDRVPAGCDDTCVTDLSAFAPLPNVLLLRSEDGTYEDATARLAPELLLEENSLVVSVTDLDGDGRADLYVGNDLGGRFHNRPMLRDELGVYRDQHLDLGLGHNAMGFGMDTMGFSTADVDGDGQLDHVSTSLYNDATALFLCREGFCEAQPADLSGTESEDDSFRWGAALVDLDLDGRPDLVESTGHLSSDRFLASDGAALRRDQIPTLMRNVGGRFESIEPVGNLGRFPGSMRGIAVTDLNEDGRPDIVLAPSVGRPRLLLNVAPSVGASLRIRLVGRSPNTGALGARVRIFDGARQVGIQDRRAGEGYLGNFDPRLFFGVIGPGPFVVEVTWPNGETTRVDDVQPGIELRIEQP